MSDVDMTAHPVIPAEVAVPDAPAAPADGGWSNLQHELAATRDAFTNIKQTYDVLVEQHKAALEELAAYRAQGTAPA